jgi:hypothetical protein
MQIIQIALFIFWFALALVALRKFSVFRNSGLQPNFITALFAIKWIAGTVLILIYTYYYPDRHTADIYKYYDDAVVINSALYQDPSAYFQLVSGIGDQSENCLPYLKQMSNWAPHSEQWLAYAQTGDYNYFLSNRLITRIHALLMPFSQGFIYTHGIFFNLFSILGIVLFYRLVKAQLNLSIPVLLVFCFLPSTLLWCSGLLKDCLVFSAVCILFYALFSERSQMKTIIRIAIILLMIMLLLYTKFYIVAALALSIFWYVIELKIFKGKTRFSIISFALVGMLFLFSPLGNRSAHILSGKREEALKAAVFGDARHQSFYHNIDPTLPSILKEIPNALYDAFCFPMPWNSGGSPFILLASLENLLPIILLILLFQSIRRNKLNNLEISLLLYGISLALIIGFTTPVTGGLVRYKTAFFPFILMVLVNRSAWFSNKKNHPMIQKIIQLIELSPKIAEDR